MRELPNTIPTILRWARTIWIFLLFSELFYAAVAWRLIQRSQPPTGSAANAMARLALVFLIIALITLYAAFYLYIKLVRPGGQALQTNAADGSALAKWRKGLQFTLILAEAVSLMGFALLVTSVSLKQAIAIYAAGTIATLFFYPQNPAKI